MPTRPKGVCRIDYQRTHGYQGRVFFRGKMRTRFFSDAKYGKRGARDEAEQWIFETEFKVGKPHTPVRVYSKTWGRTGRSGIFTIADRPGYLVRVTVDGKLRTRYVSFRNRPRQLALLEAIAIRDKWLEKRYHVSPLVPPVH